MKPESKKGKVKSVIMGLFVAMVFGLAGCGGGGGDASSPSGTPAGDVSKYAGKYSGTFSGNDTGTWNIIVSSSGAITGSSYSNNDKTTYQLSGSMGSNGAFNLAAGIASNGASFAGTVDENGKMQGTWKNTSTNTTGAFTGQQTEGLIPPSTGPTVTAFAIPSTSTSLTVAITTFTATDDVGVTGYMVTESSTVPSASSTSWSPTKPVSITFSTSGSKTLYAWAKDASGLVSASKSASVVITITSTPSKSVVKTITGYFQIPVTNSAGAAVQTHNVTILLYDDSSWSSVDKISAGDTGSGSGSSTANDSGIYFFDGTGTTDSYISTITGQVDMNSTRFLVDFPKNTMTAIDGIWRTSLGPVMFFPTGCNLVLGGITTIKASSCSYTIK